MSMTLDKFLGEARHLTACALLGIGFVYLVVLAAAALALFLPLVVLARIFEPTILRLDSREVEEARK